MSYIYITEEEQQLWDLSFKSTPKPHLKLDDLKVIFHCNSYFQSIAGADLDQYTTQSTMIGLDNQNQFHFITALEHISYLSHLPNSYEMTVETFSSHEKLFHFLGNDWTRTKNYILHYTLGDELDITSCSHHKSKI